MLASVLFPYDEDAGKLIDGWLGELERAGCIRRYQAGGEDYLRVDEVKDIADKAMALQLYARQAKNTDAERKAADIRLRAERRCGELLRDLERKPGARTDKLTAPAAGGSQYRVAFTGAGLSERTAERYQELANVPCGCAMAWATNVVARSGFDTALLRDRAHPAEGKLVTFSARVKAGAPAANATRPYSGTAYGGGVITDHALYDRIAFDIATMQFATPAPLLYDHGQPIGVIARASLGSSVGIEGNLFADLAGHAAEVSAMADRGLPWQLSVGIFPGTVASVSAGASVMLNGQQLSGPLTVFRNSRVREVSIVPLGADSTATVRLH